MVQSEVGMGTTFRLEFPDRRCVVRRMAWAIGVAGESMHDIGKTVVA